MANATAVWHFEAVNLYQILCLHKVKAMVKRHQFRTFDYKGSMAVKPILRQAVIADPE